MQQTNIDQSIIKEIKLRNKKDKILFKDNSRTTDTKASLDKDKEHDNKNYIIKSEIKQTKLFLTSKRKREHNEVDNKSLKIMPSKGFSIKTKYINKCSICLEEITYQKKHFLHCGHCFHCECINHWIEIGNLKCPLCKQIIKCNKIWRSESNDINEDSDSSEIDENEFLLYINDYARNRNNNNDTNNNVVSNNIITRDDSIDILIADMAYFLLIALVLVFTCVRSFLFYKFHL